jgi:uncharacterized protein YndB with AHSA1/START domain
VSENDQKSYEVVINAPPDKVWHALTDPSMTEQYYFGTRVESDWSPGSPIAYKNPSGDVALAGEILDHAEHEYLETTFEPAWAPGAPPSKVRWELSEENGATKVHLTHSDFDFGGPGAEQVDQGWTMVLDGLKTLLETGSPPPPPGG